MSSIIQSFFIEPVVRQARKFSTTAQSREDDSSEPQSHVRRHSATTESTSIQSLAITNNHDYNPATRLGHAVFDRFVPLWSSNSSPHPPPPALSSHLVDNDTAETRSPPQERSRDTVPRVMDEGALREADMSSNPLYGTPGSLRSPDAQSSPPSTRQSSLSGRRLRRNTGRDIPPSPALEDETPPMSGSLPEDDGMRSLRQKIHEIRDMAASSEDKARKMHALMTQDWHVWQARLRARSPASFISQDRTHPPATPQSPLTSEIDIRTLSSSPLSITSTVNPLDPYGLTPEDLLPSYRPPTEEEEDAGVLPSENIPESTDPSEPNLGCKHYKRNVKIQCFDCKRWYTCRHCHDEAYVEQGNPEHKLNRKKTENMLCMLCQTAQPASQTCRECGKRAAYYYCDLCKLWDDTSTKRIYHCGECGICRRGEGLGKDYVHCKKCNVCISIQFASSHRCIERATDCDCPICGDYMFTSPSDIVAMPCGHYLHHTCYIAYMESAYKCPICKKSAVNMELQWRKLEHAIEAQPMPAQFRDTKVEIRCNDCGARGVVGYHWLGCKCGVCDGFNTVEIRLLGADEGTRRDVEVYAQEERSNRRAREEEGRRRHQQQLLQPRSYFAEEEATAIASTTAATSAGTELEATRFALPPLPNIPTLPRLNVSPYEMLERVSRSLSPIRHYLSSDENLQSQDRARSEVPEAVSPTSVATTEELGFWARNRHWFLSSDGEDDDESYSEDESMEEYGSEEEGEDAEMDDDEEDEGDGGRGLDLELTGHR